MNNTQIPEIPQKPWKDMDPAVLAASEAVPTMLAREEQLLYHWIMAHWANGAGAVVDLGCFAGGSTARLAEGHRVAGLTSKIHAYDRFGASETAKKAHLYSAGVAPFSGSDILPLATSLLAPWSKNIALHRGSIENQVWSDGAIEVLVMDASKSIDTCDRMAEIFFPDLIPGQSLVVQQDYLHWKTPWIAVQMERMAKWFTPVAFAPKDTVVFRCDAPIDDDALAAGRVSDLTLEEKVTTLYAVRGKLRAFRLAKRVNTLLEATRANPDVETAWKMQKPS